VTDQHRIGRQTIIFFLPLEMDAFVNDQNPYSAAKEGQVFWDKKQMYVNPEQFVVNEAKLTKADLAKGGFVVQYWGEDLQKIQVNGTTGSAGVEGINVLRSIYRHEQIQFRRVLIKRQREMAEAAAQEAKNAASSLAKRDDEFGTFSNVSDLLTGGAFTQIVEGVSNSIDLIFGSEVSSKRGVFKTTPTLAAFATNIDMYYQGEFFRGFFTQFSVTESATTPGLFSYSFQFSVTRRTGERSNFMPWHRSPLTLDNESVMSLNTTESKGQSPGSDGLSFPPIDSGNNIDNARLSIDRNNSRGPAGHVSSTFDDEVQAEEAPNSVPVKRKNSF
jgi:hypothetical protein